HQVARTTRRVFGRNNYNRTLETAVNPERQLEISRERRANLVPAEVPYSNNKSTARHRVYEHYSEQRVLLHALHRRSAATNALVVLRDTRWEDSRQIIATMEVDLSAGTQLVYTFPEMILSINDFHNQVEVAIQTHGYDTWQGGEKWSTLGEPSGKWDYYVRYDVPINTTPIEEVTATGWGKEFSNDEVTLGKQDFLDEYLPQWDDQFATQKQRSELKWENPFAAKCGEDHTVLHISEEKDDLPYLKFRKFEQLAAQIVKRHEEHAFLTAADDAESSTSYQPPPDAIMGPAVYPPARQNPQQAYRPDYQFGYPQGKGNTFYGGYGEYHNSQWTLPPAWMKLGVMLVLPADPGLWSDVISRWESITINRLNSQTWSDNKAKLAFMENLFGESEKLLWQQWQTAGSTEEQDRAYRDLDRITCEETKNLWSFLADFRQLAIKSGKLYFPSTTEKLFAKLLPSLSKKIEESFKARHPGLSAGVLPAIKFTHTFVSEMCKDAALTKELRDLSLCSAIPILGYYRNNRKKYGIRKSRTYKGKPYNSHQGNIARSAVYQELDLDDNWDIVSADFDDSTFMAIEESDDEQDIEEEYDSHHAFMFHPGPPTKIADMVQSAGLWKPKKELPTQSKSCEHDWKENRVTNYTICYYCGILTTDIKQQHKPEEEKDFSSNEVRLLKELLKEKTEQEEFPPLGNSQIARPFMEAEAHYSGSTTTALKIRKITNQLYNVKVEFEIPNCPMFGTTAIIDTGASACCINRKVIPEEALEPLTQTIFFNGLNSRQQATHRIKQGYFLIEGNKFKIPLIYAFDMRDSNGTEMLIGANFLRSMRGGIRIEGDEITIYKKVTRIKTSNQTEIAEIAELEVSEEEFLEINESIYFYQEGSNAFLEQFKPIIDRWIKFADAITGTGVKINIEHIEGTHNTLVDSLSRLVNLCFAECTREMKELAAAALHLAEELKLCETYKQSYNAKPKYALDDQPNTTTGQIKEKMFESKTRKPKESSLNWKPWHRDWDAITSNFQEDDASNDGNKYRYNRKGFLEEDDARSNDSIFIVDPGWDDYCLQAIKLNRPIPLCPEARRARM
nr:RNA-directed DNA polymerase [Tanacetum cinerariifolium]